MENRRGSGIFLGVVSVATLIVAIIGATFAYFSASVESNEVVEVTAYKFDADILVEEVYATRTDAADVKSLIPMKDTEVLKAVNNAGCVDKNNYKACTVLRITLVNKGDAAITLDGKIRTLLNSDASGLKYFTDLVYQPLKGDRIATFGESAEAGNFTIPTTEDNMPLVKLTTGIVTSEQTTKPMVDIADVSLAKSDGVEGSGNDQAVFYAVVYLQDALVDPDGEGEKPADYTDQSSQMGVSYRGQFVYSSGTDGGVLTATFDA